MTKMAKTGHRNKDTGLGQDKGGKRYLRRWL
jgi:hypothetical protein